MRPVGGQEKIIASLPWHHAVHAETASICCTPGIDALFWSIICVSVLTPAGLSIAAFIVLRSKSVPPFANSSW